MKKIIFYCILAAMSLHTAFAQTNAKTDNDTTYMLTYDHGGLILWGEEHFRERLQNAIEWLDKYPSFKIGLENEAQIYDYFGEHSPGILNEIRQYLDRYKGRFGIGSCTYGQPLSVFISDESNIRQIYYALEASEKWFNYRPPVYLMSEHAMHSQIPQIINGFGFEGAIMRTHYMMYGFNPTFNVPIGQWIGLDGSRIPTIPTYTGEGAEFGKTTVDTWILTRYPSNDARESLDDYRRQFSHIQPLLATRADDSGLRKEDLVREYEGNKKFQWILMDELMDKYPPATEPMVTKPNDFTVRMPWGYCGNEIWNMSRKAEVSVLTAERLCALAGLYGEPFHEQELDKAWKNLLLSQHHDVQIVGLVPEARKLLPESQRISNQLIDNSMSFFANRMTGEGDRQITVFNPLSWKRSAWLTSYVSFHAGEAKHIAVKCGDTVLPVHILYSNTYSSGYILDATIAFNAPLEPLSLTAFSVITLDEPLSDGKSKFSVEEKELLVKTPFYEVKLNPAGGIETLKNNKNELLLQNGNERSAYFEGTIDKVVSRSEGRWTIHKSQGNAPWIKMSENGFIADVPYTFELTFYEDKPLIECNVEFNFNGQMIGLPTTNLRDSHSPFVHDEKLRFKMFPLIEKQVTGVRDLPFAIAETEDKTIEGNYWTALTDGDKGWAVFNKGNMAIVREQDRGLSIPLAYSMYYIWGTRPLYGKYDYAFAFYPFEGSWQQTDLPKRALEYAFPTPTCETLHTTNELGLTVKPIQFQFDSNELMMTALYPQKGNIIARFFKYGDKSDRSTVKINAGALHPSEVNLSGKMLNPNGSELSLTPWQFKTVRLKKE
ncbi:MAG: hypothetical protein LBE56_06380 [Tannerella sp.]|jgi:alpha-mannosidase|nr:hypothetical protein [Tannerella sp.]